MASAVFRAFKEYKQELEEKYKEEIEEEKVAAEPVIPMDTKEKKKKKKGPTLCTLSVEKTTGDHSNPAANNRLKC